MRKGINTVYPEPGIKKEHIRLKPAWHLPAAASSIHKKSTSPVRDKQYPLTGEVLFFIPGLNAGRFVVRFFATV
jgi:hypothetical protein